MGRLLRFSSQRSIDEAATSWLTRIDAGLTPDLRAELDDWLRLDPRHPQTLTRLASLWDEMDVLQELSAILPLPPPTPALRNARGSRPAWTAALAASLVAVVVAVRGLSPQTTPSLAVSDPTTSPALAERAASRSSDSTTVLTTNVGEQRNERLADGSVVHLNTSTELRVAFTPGERHLTLVRGEAQFDVMHDAGRPFLVRVGGRTIRAIGTAFNVRLTNDRVEVLVTEGRVAIAESPSPATPIMPPAIEVSAGQLAALGGAHPSVTQTQPVDANARLAWQRGMIAFRGEPLASALAEVERYTSVRFALADPELGKLRIGGYYKIGDVEGLQRSLVENFPLAVSREGDRVVIHALDSR